MKHNKLRKTEHEPGTRNGIQIRKDTEPLSKIGEHGRHELVPKSKLNVDGRYQRNPSKKMWDIARHWDWKLCGALSVIERPNGDYVVYDGGTRAAASFYRPEITHLPCLIFTDAVGLKDEAVSFVAVNTNRVSVEPVVKFNALVVAKDPTALFVKDTLAESGYSLKKYHQKENTTKAATLLMHEAKNRPDRFPVVFALMADIADGDFLAATYLGGGFALDRKLIEAYGFGLDHADIAKKLRDCGYVAIKHAISKVAVLTGHYGAVVSARGILNVINMRRTSNRYSVGW